MSKALQMTGLRFERLVALKQIGKDHHGSAIWLCRCDCGNECDVKGYKLKNGVTKSCGCLRKDRMREKQFSHGGAGSRLYSIWLGMKQRCYYPNADSFVRYGGRGIQVCDEWVNAFSAFREWALSNGYRDDLSIDRIDNDGSYCPNNCSWETVVVQANNRSSNRYITFNGVTKTIAQWSADSGIGHATIRSRLSRFGSDHERVFAPVRRMIEVMK